MKRRDKTGGKAAKAQRPKTLKRGSAPKIAGRRSSPVSNMDTDVARLTRERDEALERQTATAEILGAISGSPTDTQPVFDAIVQSGLKLFPGAATTIVLPDGDQMQAVAIADKDSKREKAWRRRFPSCARPDPNAWHGDPRLQGDRFSRRERACDGPDGAGRQELSRQRVSGNHHHADDSRQDRNRRNQRGARGAGAALRKAARAS